LSSAPAGFTALIVTAETLLADDLEILPHDPALAVPNFACPDARHLLPRIAD
jgi:hypothetical protein